MSESLSESPGEGRPGPAARPEGGAESGSSGGGGGPRRNRRRGSRGGRGRGQGQRQGQGQASVSKGPIPSASPEALPPPPEPETAGDDDRVPDLPDRPGEGRPSPDAAARALIPAKPKIGDTRPAPAAPSPAPDEAEPDGGSRRRRRRGGRGRGGAGARQQTVLEEAAELDEETLERRRGRERKGRPVGRYLMAVHVRPQATQIAVMEGRALIEHYVSRPADDATQIHGNIYLGKVQNVLPGMEAAFVDIGTPKNAVLYRGDVQFDAEDVETGGGNARIEQILKARQSIVCQVTKNPIGAKGARLTQEVSLAGRFVVMVPGQPETYGISKRLPDDER